MTEETCRQTAHCAGLLRQYREATGTRKEEIRSELLRYILKGVYVDVSATGSARFYRIREIVEEEGQFIVLYSHNPVGASMRMPLLQAVGMMQSMKMVYGDLASA